MKNSVNRMLYEIFLSLLIVASLLCFSCGGNKSSKNQQLVLQTGESRLAVPGGNIWYKVTGTGTGTPVVLLHGGPGMSSFYLKPFEDLANDRQVVRYDQLGGGKSDVISDTTMFTVDHFVKELELLREHLGISKWHILGHSWGTILALEYYRAYPDRVASIIFGSSCFNIQAFTQHARQLLTTLPEPMQESVRKAEATGKYDDSLYLAAVNQFYSLYLFRNILSQADLDSTWATFNQTLYQYMQGPSEFTVTGTLKNYNSAVYLSQIKIPTLFTVGEFDEVGPDIVKGYADQVPGSRYILFPGAAHLTSWDARDENVRVVREFLNSADSLAVK